MSRLLFLVTTLVLFVHEGKADCSGTANPKACELWSALQDNFGGASWAQCGTSATNSRYINPCGNAKCPVRSGLVTCNGNSQITSFNFGSDNNLVAEADISSFVSMLETYRDSYNFQSLTLKNQASLGLDECLDPCADGLTCDFTGSECTGSCTTDGICVTDAPTPAPTSAPTRKADCSGTAYPKACELWSALQDNFGGASWSQCGTSATNSRYINPCGNAKCPVRSGLVTCNGNSQITSFNFGSDNNLVAEADISSFVSMLETYRDSYNFQSLTLKNQASLGLDECLEPCADGLTCDFTGSECTGSCTTDGICVTDAPTPAPTSAPTRKADCSGTAYPKACELWSALQDNFGGASWSQCGTSATNSRYVNPCGIKRCPVRSGLVTCNSNSEITSFNFNSENNLVAEADISSFVSMLETYRDSYNLQTLTLQNQASLGLDECLLPCADGLTCEFTGSECTGSCTTDGICVTDAPTPAPTSAPTSMADCSGTTNPQACKLWVALQDNFGGASWTRCGITTNNARYINACSSAKCPLQNGLVMCNSKGEITSINFNSENNLVAEADISSFVSMLETYRDSYNFQTLTLQNQASLGLDECLEPCADGLTCDFTGSECTGSCTTDGICVTDAPTPAPTPLRTARPAQKPKEGVRCDRFNTRFVRQKCNLWNSLMDAFTSDDWKVCQSSRNENPCSAGACAQQEGFVGWICMYWCMHKRWTMCTLT